MTWAKLALVIAQILAMAWRTLVSAKDRALGRSEATEEALRKQAEENKAAVDAFDEAEKAHAKAADDSAFDQDFRRDS